MTEYNAFGLPGMLVRNPTFVIRIGKESFGALHLPTLEELLLGVTYHNGVPLRDFDEWCARHGNMPVSVENVEKGKRWETTVAELYNTLYGEE